jgi:hypothetical protein
MPCAGAERLSAAQPLDERPLPDILPAKSVPIVPAPAVHRDAPHVLNRHLVVRRLCHLHAILPCDNPFSLTSSVSWLASNANLDTQPDSELLFQPCILNPEASMRRQT